MLKHIRIRSLIIQAVIIMQSNNEVIKKYNNCKEYEMRK